MTNITKQQNAKKALNALYLEVHHAIAADVKSRVLQAFDEIREDTINDVVKALQKQMDTVTYENGYPIDAVPKSTILSLPILMKTFYSNEEPATHNAESAAK
jgi:hypothetical protein